MLGLLSSRLQPVRTRSTTSPLRWSKQFVDDVIKGLILFPLVVCYIRLEYAMGYSQSVVTARNFAETMMCARYIHLYEPTDSELTIINRVILMNNNLMVFDITYRQDPSFYIGQDLCTLLKLLRWNPMFELLFVRHTRSKVKRSYCRNCSVHLRRNKCRRMEARLSHMQNVYDNDVLGAIQAIEMLDGPMT